jgi:hypothetical protein
MTAQQLRVAAYGLCVQDERVLLARTCHLMQRCGTGLCPAAG